MKAVRLLTTEKFAPGAKIIKQDDKGDKFYIIKSGQAEVLVAKSKGGEAEHVNTLQSGDYFGEMALVRDEKRSASIIAHGDHEARGRESTGAAAGSCLWLVLVLLIRIALLVGSRDDRAWRRVRVGAVSRRASEGVLPPVTASQRGARSRRGSCLEERFTVVCGTSAAFLPHHSKDHANGLSRIIRARTHKRISSRAPSLPPRGERWSASRCGAPTSPRRWAGSPRSWTARPTRGAPSSSA